MKDSGVYSLIIRLKKDQKITIGKLGKISFKKGFYIYTGSALNGLTARVERHRKKKKKKFWHIDYLLNSKHAKISEVFMIKTNKKIECKLNKIISVLPKANPIKNFGCSDCRCKTHLYYFEDKDLINFLKNVKLT